MRVYFKSNFEHVFIRIERFYESSMWQYIDNTKTEIAGIK